MKITIFGTGYVGLVTGTCLADVGHDVMCMDVDADKIARLHEGEIPIYEPGLEAMVAANVASGRLRFTTDPADAVAHGALQFIAVGTPPDEDGSADLKYVLAVAQDHRRAHERVQGHRRQVHCAGRHRRPRACRGGQTLADRGVASTSMSAPTRNSSRKGAAIEDFSGGARIVVGTESERVKAADARVLRALQP